MVDCSVIGIVLAKSVFQAHGSHRAGQKLFSKKLLRRQISDLGHEMKQIPSIYVKSFAKRQKNDATDAEAIAETASRQTMRFAAAKSVNQCAAWAFFVSWVSSFESFTLR